MPPNYYPDFYVSAPSFVMLESFYAVQSVYIAAPIHPIPYRFGDDDGPTYGQVADYYGVLNSATYQSIDLEFYNPGVYVVKLHYFSPTIPDLISFAYVSAAKGDTQANPAKDSRQQKLELPQAALDTLVVIEIPARDNGYIDTATRILSSYQRAGDVDQLIGLVNLQYAANNNQPITVVLVAHGEPNFISVGTGTAPPIPNSYLGGNGGEVQRFVNACRGEISAIILVGCNVAQTLDTNPQQLMNSLSGGLMTPTVTVTVAAWDQEIAANDNSVLAGPAGVTYYYRQGYFSVDVHSRKRISVNGTAAN